MRTIWHHILLEPSQFKPLYAMAASPKGSDHLLSCFWAIILTGEESSENERQLLLATLCMHVDKLDKPIMLRSLNAVKAIATIEVNDVGEGVKEVMKDQFGLSDETFALALRGRLEERSAASMTRGLRK